MLTAREHGTSGPLVVVLHGGPGAPGSAASLARELAVGCRVLEPLQRGSGPEPLTVARHVADLQELIEGRCAGVASPTIVGHSWGAMLALAHAAAHPRAAGAIALIGCGTFDAASRARLSATLGERIPETLMARLNRLSEEVPDPDARLATLVRLLLPSYSHQLLPEGLALAAAYAAVPSLDDIACDARAHDETWGDMLRLQDEGVYPSTFASIEAPVLMLHGDLDPHPGGMIRDRLAPFIPHLEYQELRHCGHFPWIEAEARDPFLGILRAWLAKKSGT